MIYSSRNVWDIFGVTISQKLRVSVPHPLGCQSHTHWGVSPTPIRMSVPHPLGCQSHTHWGVSPTPIGVSYTLLPTLSYVIPSVCALRILHVYVLIVFVRLAMVCVCTLKKNERLVKSIFWYIQKLREPVQVGS